MAILSYMQTGGTLIMKNLQKAADEYLFLNPGSDWIQYDVISITMNGKEAEYFLIEDIFL